MLQQVIGAIGQVAVAMAIAAIVCSIAVTALWYLPRVLMLLFRLRRVDRDAYDLAGGNPFASIHGSQPLRLFIEAGLYENLGDERARELARSVARAYFWVLRLWKVALALVAILALASLLEYLATG